MSASMMSLRTLARSSPRIATRTVRLPLRQNFPALSRLGAGTPRVLPRNTFAPGWAAAFSTSRSRFQASEELAAKLESELAVEKDNRDAEAMPDAVKEFLDRGEFEIDDKAGLEEVTMTRTYNGEKIKIAFSIADINNADQEEDDGEDSAMFSDDEDFDHERQALSAQSGGANTKGSVNKGRTPGGNIKVAPEDRVAPADRPELNDEAPEEEESQQLSFPANVRISIERSGKGALTVEAVVTDGEIMVGGVSYYPDGELAAPKNADKEWQRRSLYTGPPFGNLDEDLQLLIERYLEERGINTQLALFIPEYIDYKEQREYLRWLSNFKSFVDN